MEKYTARLEIDGVFEEVKATTYEEATSALEKLQFDNFLEHPLGVAEIRRIKDGHIMYSSEHDYVLQIYERMSSEEWDNKTYLYRNEISEPKPRVYIDVDGTLGKFYPDGRGFTYPEQILDPQYEYFRNIEPHRFMVDLTKSLNDAGVEVCVLSATDRMCFIQRFEWIKEHLPFLPENNIFICPIGADKSKFCSYSERSILIDDFNPNGQSWDGKFIKCVNSINSKSEEYDNILVDVAENDLSKTDYQAYLQETTERLIYDLEELQNSRPDISIKSVLESKGRTFIYLDISKEIQSELRKNVPNMPLTYDLVIVFDDNKTYTVNAYYLKGYDDYLMNISGYISPENINKINKLLKENFPKGKEMHEPEKE